MADRRFLTLRKTIMFYICIGNIFLLFGCAKTEMVSEDNTVTNENIASTTGTIAIETEAIETESQDAIQPSTAFLQMLWKMRFTPAKRFLLLRNAILR